MIETGQAKTKIINGTYTNDNTFKVGINIYFKYISIDGNVIIDFENITHFDIYYDLVSFDYFSWNNNSKIYWEIFKDNNINIPDEDFRGKEFIIPLFITSCNNIQKNIPVITIFLD